MAITLLQQPASASLAQSPIAFSVSESSAANTSASFQYNSDLYFWTGAPADSGSTPNYVLVKYPNASNVGIFDFSRIINSSLTDLREENPSNVVYFKGDFYFTFLSGSEFLSGSKVSSDVFKALDGYAIFQEPINQQINEKSPHWPLMTDGPVSQSIFEENKGTVGVYTSEDSNNAADFIQYSSAGNVFLLPLSSSTNSNEIVQQAPLFPSEDGFSLDYNDTYSVCPVSSSVSSSLVTVFTDVSASFSVEPLVEGEQRIVINENNPILNNANSICFYTGSSPLFVVEPTGASIFEKVGDLSNCAEVISVDCDTNEIILDSDYVISNVGDGFDQELVFANSCDATDNVFVSSSIDTVFTTIYTNVGECLHFEEICKQKYPNIRIKWKNRYGQYDYHNFFLVNRQTFSTTSRSYQPQLGSWGNNGLAYNDYDSNKLNYIVDSEQFISVNSGYLDEEYNEIFKQLLVSDEIYWVYNEDEDKLRPITIATQQLVFKTGVNDKLIQYQMDFQFGQGYKLIL
jgi:hypothetical protein